MILNIKSLCQGRYACKNASWQLHMMKVQLSGQFHIWVTKNIINKNKYCYLISFFFIYFCQTAVPSSVQWISATPNILIFETQSHWSDARSQTCKAQVVCADPTGTVVLWMLPVSPGRLCKQPRPPRLSVELQQTGWLFDWWAWREVLRMLQAFEVGT